MLEGQTPKTRRARVVLNRPPMNIAEVRDGAFSRVTTARHRLRKVYPGCSEGSLRNRSSKASRSARVSHSARARHGTPVRELDLPVARSHVGTERLPRSTHRTRWPSPSPPTSPRRRRLPPGDASRPSAASPRAQPRVSRCPISTRRFVSRFVAPSRIEPVESRRGVPWRRRDGTDRTPPSGLKWIGAIARLMSICALADASPPPSPADRAHCRPRARQDRRG